VERLHPNHTVPSRHLFKARRRGGDSRRNYRGDAPEAIAQPARQWSTLANVAIHDGPSAREPSHFHAASAQVTSESSEKWKEALVQHGRVRYSAALQFPLAYLSTGIMVERRRFSSNARDAHAPRKVEAVHDPGRLGDDESRFVGWSPTGDNYRRQPR